MHPYILGFVAADGHVSEKDRLIISQSKDGYDLLVKIRDFLGCGNIIEQKNGTNHYGKKKMFRFELKLNNSLVSFFETWGINKGRKSYSLTFPDIKNDNDIWLYLRGYFDGDGTICRESGKKCMRVQIIANNEWCKKCSEFLQKYKISSFICKDKRHFGLSNIHIRRRNHIYTFMENLYSKDFSLKLDWKYEKWIEISKIIGKCTKERKYESECKNDILSLLKEGLSYSEIASKIGCSKMLVGKIKRSFCGSVRDSLPKKRKEIDKFLSLGKKRSDIEKMGYGQKLIKSVFENRFGSSKEFMKRKLEKKRNEVREMLLKGFFYKDIARSLHVDFGTISKIKKEIKENKNECAAL